MDFKNLIKKNVGGASEFTEEQFKQLDAIYNNSITAIKEKAITETRNKTIGEERGLLDKMLKEAGIERKGKTNEILITELKKNKEQQSLIADLNEKLIENNSSEEIDKLRKELEEAKQNGGREYIDKMNKLSKSLLSEKSKFAAFKKEKEELIGKMTKKHNSETLKRFALSELNIDTTNETHKILADHLINSLNTKLSFNENRTDINVLDDDGTVLRNPDNKNNPYKLNEYLANNNIYKQITKVNLYKKEGTGQEPGNTKVPVKRFESRDDALNYAEEQARKKGRGDDFDTVMPLYEKLIKDNNL